MKSVLISIKPQGCELITSGKETVEVRKTRPKIDTPFKVYIYCTTKYDRSGDGYFQGKYCGKVIGEFVCNKITEIKSDAVYSKVFGGFDVRFNFNIYEACLTEEQIFYYLGEGKGYGWYISDLVIYDEPKELGEFFFACKKQTGTDCSVCIDRRENTCKSINRPPQSWCYVKSEE